MRIPQKPNLRTHQSKKAIQNSINDRNRGTFNNLVVFIRFSDETGFSSTFTTVNNNFNDSANSTNLSLYNYFKATSYGQLFVRSSFYPAASGQTIVSYQDTFPRSYYQPYNSVTNPNGYDEDNNERTEREHALLKRAILYVANMIPSTLDLDYDNDGYVDNVCFIINGTSGAWSSLLWPHRWALYSEQVDIHGKRVYDFNFIMENQMSTSVLCHEMQHTLSYPDLYHYDSDYNDLSPVYRWDIMEYNMNPPQMSGAYVKWEYGNWTQEPVEISTPGVYTLHSVGSGQNVMAYKILTNDPD